METTPPSVSLDVHGRRKKMVGEYSCRCWCILYEHQRCQVQVLVQRVVDKTARPANNMLSVHYYQPSQPLNRPWLCCPLQPAVTANASTARRTATQPALLQCHTITGTEGMPDCATVHPMPRRCRHKAAKPRLLGGEEQDQQDQHQSAYPSNSKLC